MLYRCTINTSYCPLIFTSIASKSHCVNNSNEGQCWEIILHRNNHAYRHPSTLSSQLPLLQVAVYIALLWVHKTALHCCTGANLNKLRSHRNTYKHIVEAVWMCLFEVMLLHCNNYTNLYNNVTYRTSLRVITIYVCVSRTLPGAGRLECAGQCNLYALDDQRHSCH